MSDSAFPTTAYPAYTTAELHKWLAEHAKGTRQFAAGQYDKICAELSRRGKVESGDVSAMTPGERLRFAKKQG